MRLLNENLSRAPLLISLVASPSVVGCHMLVRMTYSRNLLFFFSRLLPFGLPFPFPCMPHLPHTTAKTALCFRTASVTQTLIGCSCLPASLAVAQRGAHSHCTVAAVMAAEQPHHICMGCQQWARGHVSAGVVQRVGQIHLARGFTSKSCVSVLGSLFISSRRVAFTCCSRSQGEC